ncbi:hypothetical protein, partial [Flavihumibacter sp. CACIAM 22H1]|uniref:hypothetical protein n=1 Tax=Flavihumibacter sp. CACIAM 22H1 TaxID=1812911 RepID=UPI000B051B06
VQPPARLEELAAFSERLPAGKKIAVALCPTDCWCVFLSICAQLAEKEAFSEMGLDPKAGALALELMSSWKSFLHPASYDLNAIQLLDRISAGEEIVYTPMVFGYTNYARKGFRDRLVRFGNAPVLADARYSTILGGAGIAVPTLSTRIPEAIDFLTYLLDPIQYGSMYVKHGGQSAHVSDWQTEQANLLCNAFFFNTMDTMQRAYLRPRIPGFNRFQEEAAEIVHAFLVQGGNSVDILNKLNQIYHEYCVAEVDMP